MLTANIPQWLIKKYAVDYVSSQYRCVRLILFLFSVFISCIFSCFEKIRICLCNLRLRLYCLAALVHVCVRAKFTLSKYFIVQYSRSKPKSKPDTLHVHAIRFYRCEWRKMPIQPADFSRKCTKIATWSSTHTRIHLACCRTKTTNSKYLTRKVLLLCSEPYESRCSVGWVPKCCRAFLHVWKIGGKV